MNDAKEFVVVDFPRFSCIYLGKIETGIPLELSLREASDSEKGRKFKVNVLVQGCKRIPERGAITDIEITGSSAIGEFTARLPLSDETANGHLQIL